MAADELLKTDLKLRIDRQGRADLDLSGDMKLTHGVDNLAQALLMRLLVERGELAHLGHPRYGNRVRELLGRRTLKDNLELLKRYVRQALLEDPRVLAVTRLEVEARPGGKGEVDVRAWVRPQTGEDTLVEGSLGRF